MGKIICIIIAILALIAIIFVSIYNRIQYFLIKLNKSNANIKKALNDKYFVIERYIDLLNNKISLDDDVFHDFKNISIKNINNFNLDIILNITYNDIKMIVEEKKKELKDVDFKEINKEIFNLDIIINSCKKYYNDNLMSYNKLISYFPTNFVAKFIKSETCEFYLEESKEELKILK